MGTSARVSQSTLGALSVFVAAGLAATWPLPLSPAHRLAGGLGDPLLNATILAWDADRIAHAFRGFWDAPFLFPHRHALAYSEHLLGIAWFTAPVAWLSRNPVLAYNAAYVASYVLAGFGMFLLVRTLVGRTDAAILAGLVFEVTQYRLAQAPHLQVLMNGWMPLGLWALHRYFASGDRRWLAAFTCAYAVLGLSNGYYFYYFALPTIVVAAFEIASHKGQRRRIAAELAASLCALVLFAAPIALVYYRLQQQHGFVRAEEELGGLSATLTDYFRVTAGAWNWRGLLPVGGAERQLFHGFIAIGFALLGVMARRTRTVASYAVVTATAIWMSMGTRGGPLYGWLFRHVPGFNGLRVPARFSAVAIVGLAVLAGAGFAWVLERLPRASGIAWAAAIAGIVLLEGQHGVALTPVPGDARSWNHVAYEWLRDSPPGAVLELNITREDDFHPFTTMYQLEAVRHRHPIVNGHSGWKSLLQEWLGGDDSPLRDRAQLPDAIRGLRAIGVRYVLLHDDTFARPAEAAQLTDAIRALKDEIAEEHRFGETWAWRLADADAVPADITNVRRIRLQPDHADASQQRSRAEFLVDGDPDTRWLSGGPQTGDEWIELKLPSAADVARVELATAGRSFYDYPRHLRIEADGRPIFDGSIVSNLVRAIAVDERYPKIAVDLPPNTTTRLRIRSTVPSDRWWSVHEVELFKR